MHILYKEKNNRNESGFGMNIFKKLLRKEFGETRYNGLTDYVMKYCGPEVKHNKELFDEIYEYCDGMDSERIVGMQLRLNEVMYNSFQVGRTYSLAFFIYLAAWFVLLNMNLQTEVLLGGIGAITVCFGLKTYQFFTNRCRYVDARIIEAYRSVLERILMHRAGREQKNCE